MDKLCTLAVKCGCKRSSFNRSYDTLVVFTATNVIMEANIAQGNSQKYFKCRLQYSAIFLFVSH